jgi:hypothetical protein
MWAVELRWVVVFLALYTAAVFFLGRWHARRSGFRFPWILPLWASSD